MRRSILYLIVLVLLLIAVVTVPAQVEGAPGTEASERRAVIVTGALDAATQDNLTEDISASALGDALFGAGVAVEEERRVLSAEGSDPEQVPSEQRVTRVLAGLDFRDASVVAAAFYLLQGDVLVIQFVLYDPVVETVLGGVLTRARSGLTLFTAVEEAVAEFEPSIERYVAGGYQYEPPPGIVQRITIHGPQEGAEIYLIGEQVGRISGGELVVPYTQFEVGTTLPVEVRKEGYHDFSRAFPLEEPEIDLQAPRLFPKTRFDAHVRWSFGLTTGFGVGTRVHINPDQLYAGIEHHRTVQTATPQDATVRHVDYNLRVGRYIVFPYSSFLRVSVATGLGFVLTDVEGERLREYVDTYVIVGDPTVELSVGRVRFFGRLDLRYALGVGYNLLGRAWIRTPYGLPPISAGVGYAW
ncbi:MAG: hypothetical protein GVY29_04435 [Spirochaetes bacterium]|jgi:hypothetical protein|nr:hypothetical protein [Spirochaetota bacterium]